MKRKLGFGEYDLNVYMENLFDKTDWRLRDIEKVNGHRESELLDMTMWDALNQMLVFALKNDESVLGEPYGMTLTKKP